MADFITSALVTRPDGTKAYTQDHGFYGITDEQAAVLADALDKHAAYLKQLERDQKKEPGEIFTAVLTATGQEPLTFTGITYDSFQKAYRAWGKMGDDLVKALEQSLKMGSA